jgi:hypothetical protein
MLHGETTVLKIFVFLEWRWRWKLFPCDCQPKNTSSNGKYFCTYLQVESAFAVSVFQKLVTRAANNNVLLLFQGTSI